MGIKMLISNNGRHITIGDTEFRADAEFRNITMVVNGITANYPISFLFETEFAGALSLAREQWEEFQKYN
jgi:hypothetical protein